MRDVVVLLETNEQAQGNWALVGDAAQDTEAAEQSGSENAASAGFPVIVEIAEVRNVKVTYRDPGAEPLVAALASLDITADDADYTVMDACGQVKGESLKLAAKLGPEQALVPVFGKYSLDAGGTLAVEVQDYRFQGWTIRFKDTEAHLDGNVGRSPDMGTELSIEVAGPSLASLNPELPAIPFEASLIAKLATEHLALDSINATFGESDLSGAIEVYLGDKTTLGGKLQSKRLDLTPFAADEGEAKEKPAPESDKDGADSEFVFVDEPLPFETLNGTDLDIASNVDQLTFKNVLLENVVTRVELKDGNLHFTNKFAGPQGGRSGSDIAFTTSGRSAKLDMDDNMRDLRLNLLSGDVKDLSLVPPIGITLDIKSSGASARALASSSNGRMLVTAGTGQIENNILGTVSGDVFAKLFSALNPYRKEDAFTTTDCTILALDITNGMADIAGLYSQGEKVMIVGDGTIDLNSEALNIEFNTKPRKGAGVSADMFVTPFVKLKGTLASPGVGLDEKGALLAVGTGCISVLAQARNVSTCFGQSYCR